MPIDLSQFLELFLEEAGEHLGTLEANLLRLEQEGADAERLNDIFRSAHSIKGSAGTLGLTGISSFTHVLESVLERLRSGELRASPMLTDLLLRASDVLRAMVAQARSGGESPFQMGRVRAELEAVLTHPDATDPSPLPGGGSFHLRIRPAAELFLRGTDPLLLLRDLAELGELADVQPDLSALPALASLDPESCYLGWELTLHTAHEADAVREVFAFVEDACAVEIAAPALPPRLPAAGGQLPATEALTARSPLPQEEESEARSAGGEGADRWQPVAGSRQPTTDSRQPTTDSTSLRVAARRVDELVDLVGELVITQSMVTQLVEGFQPERLPALQEAVGALQQSTRELQEKVMKVRTVPVGRVFQRFPRLVHDLAGALGKQVELRLAGEDTELDKGVIERISDPLTHLIRNAVDHGLESPAVRSAAGKPETGRLELRAYPEGGNVVIEVADDGRGLNAEAIRRRARAQGLLAADEVLGDEQAYALIFRPGFSTAEQVSDVSGRGVGMDVVKRNVEALNGALSLESAPGHGTRVRIRLPLTLAILDGLMLAVGEAVYVLPLLSVVESFRPAPPEVRTLPGGRELVRVRGESVPLVRLHRLLGHAPRETDPTRALVVVVEHQGRRLGLLTDELLGQQQVVIKSLEAHFQRVEGALGATILGDGRVALILDVQGLVRLAEQRAAADDAPALPSVA